MLVLSRKHGEKVYIGSGVTVTVVELKGHQVRIGIEAPKEMVVLRGELSDQREFVTTKCRAPTNT